MPYPRHPTIGHYLNKVRLHTKPYTATILGEKIIIFPMVMSPKYDRSSQIFLSMLPSQQGKSFLDIGTGCGIISLFVAKGGASQIVATDINEQAVKNARANFAQHKLANIKVLKSDLFEKIDGIFDSIFFNAPFHGNNPQDILEYGTSDEEYKTLTRFFREAAQYLAPKGKIYLGFSNMGDIKLLQALIANNSFVVKKFESMNNGDWTAYFYTLVKTRTKNRSNGAPAPRKKYHICGAFSLTQSEVRTKVVFMKKPNPKKSKKEIFVDPRHTEHAFDLPFWRDNQKLWALKVPVEDIPTEELLWILDIPFWEDAEGNIVITANEVIQNPEKYPDHWVRIQNSDTSFPLDIMKNPKGKWLTLDGLHRLVKLVLAGEKNVTVRKIPPELIHLTACDE